jgi:hypothetical protein
MLDSSLFVAIILCKFTMRDYTTYAHMGYNFETFTAKASGAEVLSLHKLMKRLLALHSRIQVNHRQNGLPFLPLSRYETRKKLLEGLAKSYRVDFFFR